MTGRHVVIFAFSCWSSFSKSSALSEELEDSSEVQFVAIVRDGKTMTAVRRSPGASATHGQVSWQTTSAGVDPILNGDFVDGLAGWTWSESAGSSTPGEANVVSEEAIVTEGDSFLVTLQQTFDIPEGAESLSFDLIVDPGFDLGDDFIPDAFEATLLDDNNLPVMPPWDILATSFFNMQEDGTINLGSGTTWEGTPDDLIATVDITGVAPGTQVTLYFDFIGADTDTGGAVRLGNVDHRACDVPVAVGAGCRAITVTPQPTWSIQPMALKLTSPTYPCLQKYVTTDGYLVDTPVLSSPYRWGTVAIADEDIIPSAHENRVEYEITAECEGAPVGPSTPPAQTYAWGDIDGNGVVNVFDIFCILDGIAGDFTDCPLEACEIDPCIPNRVLNVFDALAVLDSIAGVEFPCAFPCGGGACCHELTIECILATEADCLAGGGEFQGGVCTAGRTLVL